MALLTTCNKCNAKIAYGESMCDKCKEIYKNDYDRSRDSYSKTFYQSKEWEHTVEQVKRKYFYLDIYEYYINNTIVYGDIGHHIEELRDNKVRRLDITNLIYLTTENHNMIHALYKKNKKETQLMLYRLIDRWNKEMNV